MHFYRLWFLLEGKNLFFIWYSNDHDGIITNENDKLITFISLEDLEAYAINNKIELKDEKPILHDVDFIFDWLKRCNDLSVDCYKIMATWNLFSDIASSVNTGAEVFSERSKRLRTIYRKVFEGCNLPAMRGDNPPYIPTWNKKEISDLKKLLSSGMHLLSSKIRIYK